jgi:Tetratricopeptide repeat
LSKKRTASPKRPIIAGRFALILVVTLVLAACTATSRIRWPLTAGNPPQQHLLNPIPFFPQEKYQCGPAALAMALTWSGIRVTPRDLKAEVFTPSRKGSLQSAMIAATRRHDRIAYLLPGPGALIDEVAAGHAVIVLQNLGLSWYPVWHYAVVVGLDLVRDNVILHSGKKRGKQLAVEVFEHTWARSDFWGLLVLPPSQLPAVARANDYLQAVSDLERLGRYKTAADAYRTALNRWPDSLAAYIGLGGCDYELGQLKSAEAVFREATHKFPHAGAAYNDLAQVLMDQGRKAEALDAAKKAIECGGPLKARFEDTLREIR